MKKFGTPMAAAPGSAIEIVGLLRVGVPSGARTALRRWAARRLVFSTVRLTLPVSDSVLPPPLLLGTRPLCGLPVLPPPPVIVLPPPPPDDWPPPPPPVPPGADGTLGVSGTEGALGVGTWGVGTGVGVETGPRSTTLCTGAGSAGRELATDPPGGTSTVTTMTWPVIRVTRAWCSWAEADVATTPANSRAAVSAISS